MKLLGGNQIRYIDKSTFGSFFENSMSGNISVENNPLECDDIERFVWLLQKRNELEYRLTASCKNGTSLWELTTPSTESNSAKIEYSTIVSLIGTTLIAINFLKII
jgi:hypothetical protein